MGRIEEPFVVADEVQGTLQLGAADLVAGSAYPGSSDKTGGTFKISQRGGGQIERSVKRGREYAAADGDSQLAENARAVLSAWTTLDQPTSKFFVNEQDHAWYEAEGGRRFLADVPGGFAWPEPEEGL